MTVENKSLKYFFFTPAVFWLVTFFVLPLLIIFIYSFLTRGEYGGVEYVFTFDNYLRIFDPLYIKPVLRSIYLAFFNTILCIIIGYPLAYFIATQSDSKKNFYLFLVILPFWTNFLVRTYAWMIILRTEGVLNNFLVNIGFINHPIEILFTEKAVLIGLVYGYLPFMVLPIYASIEKLNFSLLNAAQDLGASSKQAFFHITLPLTLPGVIAGSILVFIPTLGAYITPDLLGGSKNMMIGNLIKDQFLASRDWPFGSALSMIVMFSILVLLMLYLRIKTKKEL